LCNTPNRPVTLLGRELLPLIIQSIDKQADLQTQVIFCLGFSSFIIRRQVALLKAALDVEKKNWIC